MSSSRAAKDDSFELDRAVSAERLADHAFAILRDAILEKRIAAGSRLSVPLIARQLGISRSPAREAVARLAEQGLADIVPRRGAVVVNLSLRDLEEVYYLREVLEGLACRLAAEMRTDADLERIGNVLEEHRKAVAEHNVRLHFELDASFHREVRLVTENSRLVDALDRLQGQIRVAMTTTSAAPGRMELAFADHERIFGALLEGDASAAERAGRDHVSRLRRTLLMLDDGRRDG